MATKTEDIILNSYRATVGFLTEAIELCDGDIDPFSNVQVLLDVKKADSIVEILLRSVKDEHPIAVELRKLLEQVRLRLGMKTVESLTEACILMTKLRDIFDA